MRIMRIEKDTLGEIEVPAGNLWGAQTQRSLKFFAIGEERMPLQVIHALVQVKKAAAIVNMRSHGLSVEIGQAIAMAANEILSGKHDEEFPLSVWQTGSGTQSNMNVNEVLANLASEILKGERGMKRLVHPIDDVNRGQSSNDVFPTAMHMAAAISIDNQLIPSISILEKALMFKSIEFSDDIKIGRTHLMDATPITVGQEFSGYVAQLEQHRENIQSSLSHLLELAIGGTAVGTGLNAPSGFAKGVTEELSQMTTLPFSESSNKFAALAAHDALVIAHSGLKGLATALFKIANDIRWMASGPRSGLGEISLPENEPGSSIMPGKVNPTQCEALTMICAQVMGNDVTITLAGASGNFELNVFKPIIIHNFLQSVRLISDACRSFSDHCVDGIGVNKTRLTELVDRSLMLVTALAPHIGYDKAAQIAKKAQRDSSTLLTAAQELGFVTTDEFKEWVKAEHMLGRT